MVSSSNGSTFRINGWCCSVRQTLNSLRQLFFFQDILVGTLKCPPNCFETKSLYNQVNVLNFWVHWLRDWLAGREWFGWKWQSLQQYRITWEDQWSKAAICALSLRSSPSLPLSASSFSVPVVRCVLIELYGHMYGHMGPVPLMTNDGEEEEDLPVEGGV